MGLDVDLFTLLKVSYLGLGNKSSDAIVGTHSKHLFCEEVLGADVVSYFFVVHAICFVEDQRDQVSFLFWRHEVQVNYT